jgi:hypothetical protein
MIFKEYFRLKIWPKYWRFLLNYCYFLQKFDHYIGIREKRRFLPKIVENHRKL